MDNLFELNEKGHLKRRESFDLEFKQNFSLNNLLEYCRTLVGMANNKGGQIIFGVTDKPRIPQGMTNDKFSTCDPAKINQMLLEYFSPEIYWEMNTTTYNGKDFGILSVTEAIMKPIICKKNSDKVLREAAIYYRYRGQTKEINYSELSNILQNERDKEKLLWIQHIKQISTIGPKNVQLLDTYKGEITTGETRILIDKNILDKIKFVQEGKFVEKGGVPTLKLVGEVSGVVDAENMLPADKIYPLLTKDLQNRLNLNSYEFQSLAWKLKIKEKPQYHSEIKTSGKTKCHKYSENLVPVLERVLKDGKYLQICKDEYQKERQKK